MVFQRRGRKAEGEEWSFYNPKRRKYLHILSLLLLSAPGRWLDLSGKWLHRIPRNVGFLSPGAQKQQSDVISRGILGYKSMAIYQTIIVFIYS